MARPVLAVGSTLFLRPEDSAQDVGEGFYARVVSILDGQVLFEAIEVSGEVGNESILASVAARRQVPEDERGGSRVSTWLRQGVAFYDDESVHFGQVTDTSDLGVEIASSLGHQWKARADVVCTVSALYAILTYDLAVPPSTWTEPFIRESMGRLEKCIAESSQCPSVADTMDAIAGIAEHSADGILHDWRDARTGRIQSTTTITLCATLGNSIADDPARRINLQAGAGVRPKSKRPRLQSSYLASETSYDGQEESKSSEPPAFSFVEALPAVTSHPPALGTQQRVQGHASREGLPQTGARGTSAAARPLRTTVQHDGAASGRQESAALQNGAVSPAQAVAVLRERLMNNHELLHLLRLAMSGATDDDDSSDRGKGIHKPGSSTRRLHDFVTAREYQGTSAHTCVLRVAASSALQCYPYPSVIVLLYHLAFGRPGLLIMHLCSITLLECMALQQTNNVNMMDFGMHVPVPAARKSKTWADVKDAVNGLVLYCNTFTDSTTAALTRAVARFVTAMQSQGHWSELHLPALVYWINDRLEAYRALVDRCVNEGAGDPSIAVAWFTPSNPGLEPLQNTMIRSEINALQVGRLPNADQRIQQQQQPRQGAANAAPAWTAMPADVAAAIPSRQDHELCLRFASRRGCRVTGLTCGHFVDKSLARNVRAYILSKFDGLSAAYADGN